MTAQNATDFYALSFGCAPPEGAVTLPINLDFQATTEVVLDCQPIQAKGKFSQLQTIYIDNSDNAQPIEVTLNVTYQHLQIPAHYCGYLCVLTPNVKNVKFNTTGGVVVPIQLMNFFLPTHVWPAV
jgi:hypothetical protein